VLKYLGLSGAAAAVRARKAMAEDVSTEVSMQPRIALNQVGYLPGAVKIATVIPRDAANAEFKLYPAAEPRPVLRGTLSAPVLDGASGNHVAFADISKWTTPGRYRLSVGELSSEDFEIGKDVYREPLRLAMRAFYGQRCGCAVDLGNGYSHPACHLEGKYHPTSGRGDVLANHGGWHDAGDYGRYVVNSGLTTATLLWAWELYPQVLGNLALGIPESGGKLPDYLAEIRWNLEWMLSLQDTDGGVWHKQTSERFCGFIMPQLDQMTSYVIGTGAAPYKSTCASADLSAVMGIAARCYGAYDAAFAARCLAAAKQAWKWSMAHPLVAFANPPGIETGEYGDRDCSDEILWASAELWRTTGEAQYEKAFLEGAKDFPAQSAAWVPSWARVAPMAYWTYVLAERKTSGGKTSDDLKARILEGTALAAKALLDRYGASGYGNTLAAEDYEWGSNSVAANQSLLLLMANHFRPDPRLAEAALGNLHYLLGRNCFGVSWVTQVGANALQHPHHRPSGADGIAAPWPGLLSGGPNAKPADPAAHALPKLPPMRMWLDDQSAYSLNEVAINWNAPLVFLLAGANSLAS
jgi:endoglucanase